MPFGLEVSLLTSQVAVTTATGPCLESFLFSLVLETAFPGLRKRIEAISLQYVSTESRFLNRELTFEKSLHFFLAFFSDLTLSCCIIRTWYRTVLPRNPG